MENLVRRLGRMISLETDPEERKLRRMERLEKALGAWVERKGWRVPDRNLGEAAERLGTDSVTLFHYFEERVGMDFRRWRTRLRLEDAKRMLVERPDLPLCEVGRRVGFSNRSNFSRQFAAFTGYTPGQWREMNGFSAGRR